MSACLSHYADVIVLLAGGWVTQQLQQAKCQQANRGRNQRQDSPQIQRVIVWASTKALELVSHCGIAAMQYIGPESGLK